MSDDYFVPKSKAREVAADASVRTLYRWAEAGLFPKPYPIGPNRSGWLNSELQEWVRKKKEEQQGADIETT